MEKAIRVLVVDDEDDFRETVVKRLNARKLQAAGVESGTRALEVLQAQEFDVVVLDVKMPGLDGIETLRLMKQRSSSPEVIMLTGHTTTICGEKRIGRSRTAQFGLVFIEPSSYIDKVNYPVTSDSVYIYANSRLIFLDNNGLPTFQLTIKDFGLDVGTIN